MFFFKYNYDTNNGKYVKYHTDNKENGIEVKVELAGYSKEDVKVKYNDGSIDVSVKGDHTYEFPLTLWRHKEYDPKHIKAEMKNGLLKVFVPFREEYKTEIQID